MIYLHLLFVPLLPLQHTFLPLILLQLPVPVLPSLLLPQLVPSVPLLLHLFLKRSILFAVSDIRATSNFTPFIPRLLVSLLCLLNVFVPLPLHHLHLLLLLPLPSLPLLLLFLIILHSIYIALLEINFVFFGIIVSLIYTLNVVLIFTNTLRVSLNFLLLIV